MMRWKLLLKYQQKILTGFRKTLIARTFPVLWIFLSVRKAIWLVLRLPYWCCQLQTIYVKKALQWFWRQSVCM